MKQFKDLAIPNPAELLFAVAPRALSTRSGLAIGGGCVYPELNFTLPPMLVEAGATLGGTVASGVRGPGSFRFGGLRDFILAVQFVDGAAAVAPYGREGSQERRRI